ncbi:TrbG/VirB9 family P-type conjugative transfer protein [Escherichia coli]|uniref:TrbG/VirB9 family P-type conjugative transfer protein n=1 Tax=Escherichia coli TaxID=562 RepID=UPI001C4796B1|nr:TrbG/VirB9 family P-type conjugative transfer protein [Escherichia coli]MBV7147963.1 TrbG/VirB9 family P-type conjugative transfer protein [Escherichia coli]
MNRVAIIGGLLLFSAQVNSAVTPQGSRYDSRMQTVSYNAANTTVITAGVGYLSTLLFDDEETVLDARPGMEKGWNIQKDANRVYIRAVPVTQPVMDEEGKQVSQVFEPNAKDWPTNLFVVTTKRYYSIDLRVVDASAPQDKVSYVVSYRYPQDEREKSSRMELARLQELKQQQENKRITKALDDAQAPRNWLFSMSIGKDSNMIKPDFAYDDGRFTYIGFSPIKKIPAVMLYSNGKEIATSPGIKQIGNFKTLVVDKTNPAFVLRYGNAVIGLVNQGYGKVTVKDGSTVSPDVERVEVNDGK